MKFTIAFALGVLAFGTASSQAATPTRFWGEIPFVAAGNFVEFQATMSKTRDEARAELLDEFGSLYLPSVMAGADAEAAAKALLNVIVTLDRLRDEHVRDAQNGIPAALESQLLAQFDSLFRQEGLSPEERRAEVIRLGGWQAAMEKLRAGKLTGADTAQLAKEVLADVDYLLYGSYTVIDGGNVILTLTAENFRTGDLHAFQAQGSLQDADSSLAKQLFDFAQANERKPWVNPQAALEWILPPPNLANQLPREAKLFCSGQGARLPFARELVLAAQGGNFRDGGIPRIGEGDVFLVADLQRTTEPNYYFGTALTGDDPRGPVRSGAGMATLRPSFVCVKGTPADSVQWEQDLYRAYRKLPDSAPVGREAVEYLLERLDAYGSQERFANRFRSADVATGVLENLGVVFSDPLKKMLATLE